MTRNNLTDHLSWLLNNFTLLKPTTVPFPSASDAPLSSNSQSQISDSSERRRNNPRTTLGTQNANVAGAQARNGSNGSGRPATLQDSDQVILVEDTMARLTSTTKSKKPSLVSKQQQLLTPCSTTGNGRSSIRDAQAKSPLGKPNMSAGQPG